MRVAYIGDIVNHGYMLTTVGSSIIFLLSKQQQVDSVDIFCPIKNAPGKLDILPEKVGISHTYIYDDLFSLFKLVRENFSKYDKIIFNILPTGVGTSTLANAFMMLLPIFVRIIGRKSKTAIIYHNSTYTNDLKVLGYNGFFNSLRKYVLRFIETFYFKHMDTFFLLKSYKDIIDELFPNNRVRAINVQYLEAYATVMLNKLDKSDIFTTKLPDKTIRILLHGFWGPQKDIEGALSMLSTLIDDGLLCRIIISGGVNRHFVEYENYFASVLHNFQNYIWEYKGYVQEEDMASLLLETDLLLLPYKTPGGHSGVIEQAIFFEVPTIAMDFSEYREQSKNTENIHLVSDIEQMAKTILSLVSEFGKTHERRICVKDKLCTSVENFSLLLS